MLGHHEFLLGHYASALSHYEMVIAGGGSSKGVRKRAIVCYIQARHPEKALPLFTSLVVEDVAYVLGQEQDREGCPCPVIIEEYMSHLTDSIGHADLLALGMLWAYCDTQESIGWFKRALQQKQEDPFVVAILRELSSCIMSRSSPHASSLERN